MRHDSTAIPYGRRSQPTPALDELHILWITAGLGCDGDTVSITAASHPSIEQVILGEIPGLPKVHLHNPLLAVENSDAFLEHFRRADRGEIDNFVLILEGSVPNEKISGEGCWAAMGTDPKTRQPIKTTGWLDRLVPKALAVISAGTCASCGGIHAMQGNATGCMGLQDYLGRNWQSKIGLPIINIPGCPVHPDGFMEVLLHLLRHLAGLAPMFPVDELGRPEWLFANTVHNGCDGASYYAEGEFATKYGSAKCLVKLGCWGPVVQCNVPKRGWIGGVGGCPNVGGICIGCTMPGFPDKFMPFMDEPPARLLSSGRIKSYGAAIRHLRRLINKAVNEEPKWRHNRPMLTTGYRSRGSA